MALSAFLSKLGINTKSLIDKFYESLTLDKCGSVRPCGVFSTRSRFFTILVEDGCRLGLPGLETRVSFVTALAFTYSMRHGRGVVEIADFYGENRCFFNPDFYFCILNRQPVKTRHYVK